MAWAFTAGACVGSLLNVVAFRLPEEKSLLWPGSRCFSCLRPIRWYDNLPLISYLWLRGRCRRCGSRYSPAYLLVEAGTGAGFAAAFWLFAEANWFGFPGMKSFDGIPAAVWGCWLQTVTLFSFLLAASLCDLRRREIPLSLTVVGAAVGLIFSAVHPWPWPLDGERVAAALPEVPWYDFRAWGQIKIGLQPWPLWGPPPGGLPPGSWELGLADGLVGAAVGSLVLRLVGETFKRGLGQDALGLGDADLMMMAGAFLGWQVLIPAFFAGAIFTLVFAVPVILLRGNAAVPFGPGLAAGVLTCWFAWGRLGPPLQFVLYDELMLGVIGGVTLVFLFLAAAYLRLRRQ